MGLHSALNINIVWVWRFYDAINEKRGRSHLLLTPLVKKIVSEPPPWLYDQQEQSNWIRNEEAHGEQWGYPMFIYSNHTIMQRFCNRKQLAIHWVPNYYWSEFQNWTMPRRGICTPCHNRAMELPENKTLGPESANRHLSVSGIYSDTDMATWTRLSQGYLL